MMEKPIVSIVIANKDGGRFLKRCLDSIFEEKGDYEVILVDDGSKDESVNLVKNYLGKDKRLRLIELPENAGAAAARNTGVAKASGEYLFFLDSDTRAENGWYKETIKFFQNNKKAGAAQVKLLRMGTNRFDYAGDYLGPLGFLIERSRGAEDTGQFDKLKPIFSGKSAGMIVRKEVFKKIGGFDSDYQIFLEDTDLTWRIWLAGYEVYFVHSIVVMHAYGTKEKDSNQYKLNKVTYRGCRNMISTLIKNLDDKHLIMILPINIGCWLTLAVMALVRLDFSKAGSLLRGIGWNLIHFKQTLTKRKRIQSQRAISDNDLLSLVGDKQNIRYYLGKGVAYVTNRPY